MSLAKDEEFLLSGADDEVEIVEAYRYTDDALEEPKALGSNVEFREIRTKWYYRMGEMFAGRFCAMVNLANIETRQ